MREHIVNFEPLCNCPSRSRWSGTLTLISILFLLSGCSSPDTSGPTPLPANTPTPVSEPTPNSNGAMPRANLHGTGVFDTRGVQQMPEVKWQFKTKYSSIESMPAVADGLVYFSAGDGHLYALESGSGHEKWNAALCCMLNTSPTIADGTVYLAASEDKTFQDYLYAFD